MEQDRQHDDEHHDGSADPATPDAEHRPLGALAVTGFLTVTILVLWFAMYALNMARS